FATLLRDLMARTAPVHRLLADAARSDPEAAAMLDEVSRQRHEGQRHVARALAQAGALRDGLRERDAADVVHALASPELYGLLVPGRGGSGGGRGRGLAAPLAQQLPGPTAQASAAGSR